MKKFETFKISSPQNKSLAPFALTRKVAIPQLCYLYLSRKANILYLKTDSYKQDRKLRNKPTLTQSNFLIYLF